MAVNRLTLRHIVIPNTNIINVRTKKQRNCRRPVLGILHLTCRALKYEDLKYEEWKKKPSRGICTLIGEHVRMLHIPLNQVASCATLLAVRKTKCADSRLQQLTAREVAGCYVWGHVEIRVVIS